MGACQLTDSLDGLSGACLIANGMEVRVVKVENEMGSSPSLNAGPLAASLLDYSPIGGTMNMPTALKEKDKQRICWVAWSPKRERNNKKES